MRYIGKTKKNVKLQVYYEALCPGSKSFVSTELSSAVLKLSQYLNIYLYPAGGTKTTEKDGHYEFKCQHGPLECYGNKLHACAIDVLKNMTTAVLFNGCMMEPSGDNLGSDDLTADQCGKRFKIDSTPIKECAKEERGSILLKQYADDTRRVRIKYVPYKIINGKESVGNFMAEVCAAFVIPPPACSTEQLEWNDIEK